MVEKTEEGASIIIADLKAGTGKEKKLICMNDLWIMPLKCGMTPFRSGMDKME